jgi:hypothetical protein
MESAHSQSRSIDAVFLAGHRSRCIWANKTGTSARCLSWIALHVDYLDKYLVKNQDQIIEKVEAIFGAAAE